MKYLEQNLSRFENNHRKFQEIVRNDVVGYDDVVTDMLVGLLAKGHCLLEGVPGLAKTTLAKSFAGTLKLGLNRFQFTQDLLPADITGHGFYDPQENVFDVRKGPVFTNLLLADELNRAPPKAQSALLEAMEEHHVTIEGQTFDLPDPFFVVATMNPVDVEGTYGLPEALMDRFMIRTKMGYISDEDEMEIIRKKSTPDDGGDRMVLKQEAILEGQKLCQYIEVPEKIIKIVQKLCAFTRGHKDVALGASPRAMVQMVKGCQAHALLAGRGRVEVQDVVYLAPRILEHRLVMHVDAEMKGRTAAHIVKEAIRHAC